MSDLHTVTITTTQGSVYVFPDVSESALKAVSNVASLHAFSSFTLVNASDAAVVIPVRIIASVKDGEVEIWKKA